MPLQGSATSYEGRPVRPGLPWRQPELALEAKSPALERCETIERPRQRVGLTQPLDDLSVLILHQRHRREPEPIGSRAAVFLEGQMFEWHLDDDRVLHGFCRTIEPERRSRVLEGLRRRSRGNRRQHRQLEGQERRGVGLREREVSAA